MGILKERYVTEVVPKLKKELGIENPMRVPRVQKVIVNMGIGIVDKDEFATHVTELARITGQKPIVTKARKSISNFKLREGMSIGAKVTLRGPRMYDFLERFIAAALPRIRDFRGLPPNAFDAQGNYTVGVKEQTIFPEIDPNHVGAVQGMNITIVMSSQTRDESRLLLKGLGIPFAEK
ncbi:MAG: 50S ribosomal protein L5 [Lentisphaerae bacterium]|nr:50S ribosomal protein L5 [Lentisphaerota bacterium]